MHEEKNVQLNLDSQSYGQESVTEYCDNIQREHDKEIAKAREILRQTNIVVDNKSPGQRQDDAASTNNPSPRIARQQSRNARGVATSARSQSPTYVISKRYLEYTLRHLRKHLGPSHC